MKCKHCGTSAIKRRAAACDADYRRNQNLLAHQSLTLATICDMVLGEDAPKRDDETLVRGVRKLLNNQKP